MTWRADAVFLEQARRSDSSQPCLEPNVCTCEMRYARKTDKTEENVRATRCSVYTTNSSPFGVDQSIDSRDKVLSLGLKLDA